MTKVVTTYRFPIHLFFEPESFAKVNEFMKGFGLDQRIGMAGDSGHTDFTLTGEKEITLSDEKIEIIRNILQKGMDKILADKPELKQLTLTVKKGYKL